MIMLSMKTWTLSDAIANKDDDIVKLVPAMNIHANPTSLPTTSIWN